MCFFLLHEIYNNIERACEACTSNFIRQDGWHFFFAKCQDAAQNRTGRRVIGNVPERCTKGGYHIMQVAELSHSLPQWSFRT